MAAGLSISRLINVEVILTAQAAQVPNLNTLLIVGDSDVIDVHSRTRLYTSLNEVAADFGTTAPEYLAAVLYYEQAPQPQNLYIGRWAQAATEGLALGASLSTAQQLPSAWTGNTAGEFHISVNGAGATNITCGTMASVTNMNAVATIINTALTAATIAASVAWDSVRSRFVFSTTAKAAGNSVVITAGTSADIAAQLLCTAATGVTQVNGIAAETAVTALTIMDAGGVPWYGITYAATQIVDSDHEAIAAYVEGASNKHIYGVSTQEANCLNASDTTNVAYVLMGLGYNRTFTQFSSSNPYSAASFFGRALTVDFTANNSVITLMYKREPGITPEVLTGAQAAALDGFNCNVFAQYNNNTAIIQNGEMASGAFFDEIYNTDAFALQLQTDVYNALYTNPTKIPQTDAGNHILKTVMQGTCAMFVNNGTIGPGVWQSSGFGQLNEGDTMPSGYYIYQPPISSQSTGDRAARKSVAFQIAAKLAGAIHDVDIQVTCNR